MHFTVETAFYNDGGFFLNTEIALRLLSFTENDRLRAYLAKKATEANNVLDEQSLITRANRTHKIMRDYQLDYKQSQSLMIKGARTWMLQGGMLVKQDKCPAEIFWRITSFILGVSFDDSRTVCDAVHYKLLENKINSQHCMLSFFKNDETKIIEMKQAYFSYHQRNSLEPRC